MAKVPTRVIENGRCTIPFDLREELSLEKGDYILIDVEKMDQ